MVTLLRDHATPLSTAPHTWGTEILSPVVPRLRCLQPWSFGR